MKFLNKRDPRNYQLMVLTSMLCYGLFWLKFDLNIFFLFAIISTILLSQFLATKLWHLPRFEWRSAMISGLSLCILMRCNTLWLSLLLAAVAIFSKFLFRWNGKHIFNPTGFALALGILLTTHVSVSPGQWGNGPILAFLILCMGIFVTNKACRIDVSLAFLLSYTFILFAYSLWTHSPLDFPLKKLQTGSLLIFTFFMISDPKSTPDTRFGRIIFGLGIALLGAYLQLIQGIPGGLIVALLFISLATPWIDTFLPGKKFTWENLFIACE